MSRPALYWHADGTLTSAGGTVIEQGVTLDEAGSLYVDETITVTLRRQPRRTGSGEQVDPWQA